MKRWIRSRYTPCLPMGENGTKATASEKFSRLSRKIATEGMVLLKNNGVLPLDKENTVALFGVHHINYVKGGTGSGNVMVDRVVNLYDGFAEKEREGKVKLYAPSSEYYKAILPELLGKSKRPDVLISSDFAEEPELPPEIIEAAAKEADVAICVIGRISGEGFDRTMGKGDFCLSDEEEKLISDVTAKFDKVVVVVNSGGIIDFARFEKDDKISAVLMGWQGGQEGGAATADILCGDVCPSGKLADTIAEKFADYPSADTFDESDDYVKYYEDIYVGYRYFESFAKDKVVYPFGFGLSYTTFEVTPVSANDDGDKINVTVSVKNTGAVSGKEVVQVYYSAPQGKLGKPALELATFAKTKLLSSGEEQALSLEFPINQMGSYDDLGKCEKSAYILEKGDYSVFVGTSVRDLEKLGYTYTVNDEFVVIEKLSPRCVPYKLEKRLTGDGTYEELPLGQKPEFDYKEIPENTADAPEKLMTLEDVAEGRCSMDSFIRQLTLEEKTKLLSGTANIDSWCYGPFNGWSDLGVANTAGFGNCERVGIPPMMTADGPAGLRFRQELGLAATAWPIASLLACTWDKDVLCDYGVAVATEVKENNIGAWLAPGLNIHRNPLCGRNFEYYSEDPVISGVMAASTVKGVQSMNIAATPKHFACNNKETNRQRSDSIVSERALREIYIKGFEIAVKEADPWLIMTAYNLINGYNTSANYDLITGILRDEWGYNGAVTTDWCAYGLHGFEVMAGNDIKMPWGYPQCVMDFVLSKVLPESYVDSCIKRILELIIKIDC